MRDHFETFRAHSAALRDGEGLPRFVEQEFRDFLRCGCLAGGPAAVPFPGSGGSIETTDANKLHEVVVLGRGLVTRRPA